MTNDVKSAAEEYAPTNWIREMDESLPLRAAFIAGAEYQHSVMERLVRIATDRYYSLDADYKIAEAKIEELEATVAKLRAGLMPG